MNRFSAQRALEALRNGVPNGDAVRLLGCMQSDAIERFQTQLNQFLNVPLEADPPSTSGIIISGGFGSGKSHTLSCFEIDALERNFIVSRIVISKETPLHDPTKLFLAAVRNAKLPAGTRGPMLQELAGRIDYRSAAAAPFVEWTHRQPHQLLAASATIHEQSRDPELKERMVDWWSGGKIELKQVRDGLKGLEVPSKYTVRVIKAVDLAPVRFEFASRLARAAGFAGWVLLLDESELIAQYSLLQRARSYAELTRWLSGQPDLAIPGILAVAAITDAFDITVLNSKINDREKAPARLRQKGDQRSLDLAALAETGMEIIASKSIKSILLHSPSDDTLTVTFGKLAKVYEAAYGYRPEDGSAFSDGAERRKMRSYVRRWIGTWDLDRLYGPGPRDFVEEDSGAFNYTEDAEYESGEPVGETL